MFYSKPAIEHDFAIVTEEDDIEIVIPQHKAGESTTPDGESTTPEDDDANVPPDDSLRERDSGKDDDDSSSASSEGTNANAKATTSTRSGQVINKPARLIEGEAGAAVTDLGSLTDYEIKLTVAEEHYYDSMKEIHEGEFVANEITCVGAGIGGGFANTKELHIMKYKQAMATEDVKQWERAVDEEHDRMVKHKVWQAILIKDIPQAVKIMTSTWAMKKKPMEPSVLG
jgi:hypothetical protein